MSDSEKHSTLRLVVAALVSLLTSGTIALFTRSSLLQATRWGWLLFFLYLTREVIYSESGKKYALKFRRLYGVIPAMSYILVPLLFACLGLIYWIGINRIYSIADTDIPGLSTTPTPIAKLETPTATPTPAVTKPTPKLMPSPIPPRPTPTIAIQLPAVGNLKQRAINLSNEIMVDLHRHGWGIPAYEPLPPGVIARMPHGPEVMQWSAGRSSYFKSRLLKRVINMRDEFAQLHLQDEELNMYLDMYLDASRTDTDITPMAIASISERLKALAAQVKSE